MDEKIKKGLIKAKYMLVILDNMEYLTDPDIIEQMRLIQVHKKKVVLMRINSVTLEGLPNGFLELVDADFIFTTEQERKIVLKNAIFWIIQHDESKKKPGFFDGQTGEEF